MVGCLCRVHYCTIAIIIATSTGKSRCPKSLILTRSRFGSIPAAALLSVIECVATILKPTCIIPYSWCGLPILSAAVRNRAVVVKAASHCPLFSSGRQVIRWPKAHYSLKCCYMTTASVTQRCSSAATGDTRLSPFRRFIGDFEIARSPNLRNGLSHSPALLGSA